MPFDLATAKPVSASPSGGFDLSTARPIGAAAPEPGKDPWTPAMGLQHMRDVGRVAASHPMTFLPGLVENALSGVTGGVGSLADAVTGAQPGTHDFAYRPRTEAGQEIARLGGQETANIGRVYDKVAGTGPLATELKGRIPEALGAVGTVMGAAEIPRFVPRASGFRPTFRSPPMTAQQVLDRSVQNSPQSMGAARAAPRVGNASPELQQAIANEGRRGAVNTEALQRHLQADSLPVKVRLTEGQATQDPRLISQEQNSRARAPAIAERYNTQNRQLVENLRTVRDEVGPDVFSANHVEHGDTLINAYKAKDAAVQADINQKYNALRKAAGGDFPVDAGKLLKNASEELHKKLLFDHAPKSIMSTLGRLAEDRSMTYENFESMRTNLARIQRSPSIDGNEKAAAGVIRNELEKLPLKGGTGELKGLADAARKAARERFEAMEEDPAYEAAVHDSVPPDRFVQKFVTGGKRDEVGTMRENLEHDPAALQTMSVATLDHLRQAARIDPDGNGNFAAAGYNKALQGLSPKLHHLVDAKTAETLANLGDVARYTTAQPKGSFVNNSNTATALLGEAAAGSLEGAANFAAGGVPVGTWARRAAQHIGHNRTVKRSLAPGAGLRRLTLKDDADE